MPKIEDYALLGDLHTAALVSTTGSIDWLCLPRFDSAAAFAALLDSDAAGYWRLPPRRPGLPGRPCATRRYAGNTLVLETDWVTADGTVRVIDFMPPRADTPHIVRIAVGLSGQVAMRSVLRPRFDYGREVPWIRESAARRAKCTPSPGPTWSGWYPGFRCTATTGRCSRTSPCGRATGCRSSCPGRPAISRRCRMPTPSRPWPRRWTSGPSGRPMPATRPGRTATPSTGRSSL